MASYRARAANKGIPFELELIHFIELIGRDCFYCGEKPSNVYKGTYAYRFYWQGLDRIVNSEGYTINNVVPCCGRCNAIKSDILTPREMLAAIKAIKKVK